MHGGAFDDARAKVELVIGDAAHYVAAAADAQSMQFDLIVFDVTPPDLRPPPACTRQPSTAN